MGSDVISSSLLLKAAGLEEYQHIIRASIEEAGGGADLSHILDRLAVNFGVEV